MTRLTPSIPHASPRREADGANVPAMPNRAPTARPVAARTLSPQSLTNRYLHDGRDFTASRRYRNGSDAGNVDTPSNPHEPRLHRSEQLDELSSGAQPAQRLVSRRLKCYRAGIIAPFAM